MFFVMEDLDLQVKMVNHLMNCRIVNVSNSAGDPSLLYTTSWGQRNLCLMKELTLHALQILGVFYLLNH